MEICHLRYHRSVKVILRVAILTALRVDNNGCLENGFGLSGILFRQDQVNSTTD